MSVKPNASTAKPDSPLVGNGPSPRYGVDTDDRSEHRVSVQLKLECQVNTTSGIAILLCRQPYAFIRFSQFLRFKPRPTFMPHPERSDPQAFKLQLAIALVELVQVL